MRPRDFNLLCVGVGGQGVIRTLQILIWAAFLDNHTVRTGETHGMAQRGGSVEGYLRFGTDVHSPLMPRGYAHAMVAFEPIEAIRRVEFAGPKTLILVSDHIIPPPSVYEKKENTYPPLSIIRSGLEKVSKNVFFIKAHKMAEKAGNARSANVIMLGILSGMGSKVLPIKRKSLLKSILRYVPKKTHKVNNIAFQSGIEKGISIRGDFK
ncbi:MAG: indolepyruvate oxidoreductase subunit beta [Promethearchaeota archaeon]